ncbi:MAG: patatin-like phospholipase family protein, partial [Planctomycetaceae bacterium]
SALRTPHSAFMTGPRTILALGGGGARGVAHLGAVEAVRDAGFEIERIVGVSIGSLAGAMCAFDTNIQRVQQQTLDYLLSPTFQKNQRELFGARRKPGEETTGGLFSWHARIQDFLRANRLLKRVFRSPSLLPGALLQDVVDALLPDADIADAAVPLSIVAVDLRSGHKIVLERGPLRLAVRASSSLPGIFPPVEHEGMLLCDIGVFDSLPVIVAQSYPADVVIGVDVSSGIKRLSRCETALDVLMRMDEIGEAMFRKHVPRFADLIIRPDVGSTEWFDFTTPAKMIESGRTAARLALATLAPRSVA